MDCHAGNPCELRSDPTDKIELPMIGKEIRVHSFEEKRMYFSADFGSTFSKRASVKEIDYVQLGIVNQSELKLQPRAFFSFSLVDLGASVSVTPFSTYTNLGLGILSHTRLTIELADRTIKQPRGIAENVIVRIGKFTFLIDFIILDIPEDDDVPLILGRPFLSTVHPKINVYKRKITLKENIFITIVGTMAGVDVDTLTMEQYLALSRENQAPGVVKPEIKSHFMRELREDTFFKNKDDDAHDHIDRWVNRLSPGTINTWDLLKKAFIQRYYPSSLTTKQLEDIHNFKQEGDESLYQAWERYNDLLYKCPIHDINSHQKVNIFYKGLSTMNCQLLDSHELIPGMTPAQALTTIQTMADHSQKWHNGTTSMNIGSSSSKDGLDALIDNRPPYGEKRQSLEELLAKHQEEFARRSTEMEIEQLIEELYSRKEKYEQANVVIVEHEGPSSPKKLKNLHEISFLFDSQEENTNDQLPTNDSSFAPTEGIFMLNSINTDEPITKRLKISDDSTTTHFCKPIIQKCDEDFKAWPSCNPFRNKCDGGHEIYEINELGKIKYWFFPNNNERKEMKGGGVLFLNFLMIRYGSCQVKDTVWSERYSEWCNENSHDGKPRPRDYTFKEWVKHKKRHLDISKSVRKDLFRLWVIDKFTEALDPDKDPLERCLDEYNSVFLKEIEQLADEYEIKIGEKGQVLEEIWTRCKRARCKNKDWCFICVNGENNEILSSGRKNGSRFRKMIMEEMEEVLGNDGEDSDNET
ncbi:phospholipase-like protein [Tanacetum coccineum]